MATEYEKLKEVFVGKTVQSLEYINIERNRAVMNSRYLCFVFTDGTKVMIQGGFMYNPNPDIEEMKKAPMFFSAEDIADAVLREETKRRSRENDHKRQLEYEYNRLAKELGKI